MNSSIQRSAITDVETVVGPTSGQTVCVSHTRDGQVTYQRESFPVVHRDLVGVLGYNEQFVIESSDSTHGSVTGDDVQDGGLRDET